MYPEEHGSEAGDTRRKSSSLSRTETQQLGTEVVVRLIGVLASAAGNRELRLDTASIATVADLVRELLRTVNNPLFESYLVEAGTKDPRPNVIILLNEQDCNMFSGLNTRIEGTTVVTIIPVAHGG
ncbi:MoaD/ThiS family protein [Candidatus Bathyarchaeota archaeon]|nr:MAG: MoaD/ThiS family protein [Candidatus Bathyarchaeota archaeon]TMI33401.1 MAG: MoaD/ThiS family protein [Candidatus Bathyarchaeota archaeon]